MGILSDDLQYLRPIYRDRATIIAALARIFPAVTYEHTKGLVGYRTVVQIELPTGQVSWHIADEDVELFKFVRHSPSAVSKYDGHTHAEKEERLVALCSLQAIEVLGGMREDLYRRIAE